MRGEMSRSGWTPAHVDRSRAKAERRWSGEATGSAAPASRHLHDESDEPLKISIVGRVPESSRGRFFPLDMRKKLRV